MSSSVRGPGGLPPPPPSAVSSAVSSAVAPMRLFGQQVDSDGRRTVTVDTELESAVLSTGRLDLEDLRILREVEFRAELSAAPAGYDGPRSPDDRWWHVTMRQLHRLLWPVRAPRGLSKVQALSARLDGLVAEELLGRFTVRSTSNPASQGTALRVPAGAHARWIARHVSPLAHGGTTADAPPPPVEPTVVSATLPAWGRLDRPDPAVVDEMGVEAWLAAVSTNVHARNELLMLYVGVGWHHPMGFVERHPVRAAAAVALLDEVKAASDRPGALLRARLDPDLNSKGLIAHEELVARVALWLDGRRPRSTASSSGGTVTVVLETGDRSAIPVALEADVAELVDGAPTALRQELATLHLAGGDASAWLRDWAATHA